MSRIFDNSDWFEIEDRKQAAFEASLPKCDICGAPMTEWLHVSYKLMDILICEDCTVWEMYEED